MKKTILILAFVLSSSALEPVPAFGQTPTIKTFGPHFAGDDIKLVSRLVDSQYPVQSEFETSEHFEARLTNWRESQKPHVFVIDPHEVAQGDAVGFTTSDAFKYDADDHAFYQSFNFYDITARIVSLTTGHHVGTNAFGAHVQVRDGSYTVWHLSGSLDDLTPPEFSERLKIDMPGSQAKEVKPYLRVAIECIVTGNELPGYGHNHSVLTKTWTHDATVSEPFQTIFWNFGLAVKYLHIYVFDVRTGHTFALEPYLEPEQPQHCYDSNFVLKPCTPSIQP